MPDRYRRVSLTLMIASIGLVCGCGSSATVSGKVSFDGRPVTYGSVIFLCDDNTAYSTAIQPDGTYRLEQIRSGDVKIGVITPAPSKSSKHQRSTPLADAKAASPGAKSDRIMVPKRFRDPVGSGLIAKIGSGNVSYDIDIK
jgi:hypothetical protein